MSPNQLFVQGILASESATRSILHDTVDPLRFGVEEDGTPPSPVDDENSVVCDPPTLGFTLTTTQEFEIAQLLQQCRTNELNYFGISTYLALVQLIRGWDQ